MEDIEICSIEFKKGNASPSTLFCQQSKNLRVNACILNDIHLLFGEENANIAYLDFAGRNAYVAQLFKINDKYVAHKLGDVVIISSLLELELLRKTMIILYNWKSNLVSNSNRVSLANIKQRNKFTLVDVSKAFVRSPS